MSGYAKGRAKRQEIIDVAAEMFAENGFRGTSLRDISRKAGISHTGLLHHFSSKELLLASVINQDQQMTKLRFPPKLEDPGLDYLVRTLATRIYSTTTGNKVELFTVLVGEATSPSHPAHEFYKERYRIARQLAKSSLDLAQEEGRISEDYNTYSLAMVLIAISDGLNIQWRLDPDNFDMADAYSGFILALVKPEIKEHVKRYLDLEFDN